MITLEDLSKLILKESNSKELQELPENLFQEVAKGMESYVKWESKTALDTEIKNQFIRLLTEEITLLTHIRESKESKNRLETENKTK